MAVSVFSTVSKFGLVSLSKQSVDLLQTAVCSPCSTVRLTRRSRVKISANQSTLPSVLYLNSLFRRWLRRSIAHSIM